MKLSIITPYYNTLKETLKLAEVLEPQLNEEVEWLIIDDGCNELKLDDLRAKVIHLTNNSGCAGKPRNIGLNEARGKYIAFIDSDDMIASDYVKTILDNLDVDMLYLSWKSKKHNIVIKDRPPYWNCAVWCRVYRKNIIGKVRFNEELKLAEDWKFNKQIIPGSTKAIQKQIYIYNCDRKGSLTNG